MCDKTVCFTSGMNRTDYTYKRVVNGKTVYYCGWSHYRQDEPVEKIKSKFKDKG